VKVTGSGGYVLQKVWGEWREVESSPGGLLDAAVPGPLPFDQEKGSPV